MIGKRPVDLNSAIPSPPTPKTQDNVQNFVLHKRMSCDLHRRMDLDTSSLCTLSLCMCGQEPVQLESVHLRTPASTPDPEEGAVHLRACAP